MQFQPESFEAAMATSSKAADAAREAALAETLLLWGGPLVHLRPLLQVAELVAAGRLERVARGATLRPSPGTKWVQARLCTGCTGWQLTWPLMKGDNRLSALACTAVQPSRLHWTSILG